jgi:alpha/beta superfamily hydrolase
MPDVIFTGPAGRIEGKYTAGPSPTSPVAVVLHPHPKHGGTMNNRVVYSLFQTFVKKGFSTFRFNFRGVGRSEGSYDNGEGELADAAAAMDWLQSTHPQVNSYWVAGFSFGAWIAMQLLMRRPELDGFISVSPPTNMYDFNFLAPCPVSGQIIHGGMDTVVPQQYTDTLVQKLRNQKGIAIDYQVIEGADHFYSERLDKVVEQAENYLDLRLSNVLGRRIAS